jgi:hypothetical protein
VLRPRPAPSTRPSRVRKDQTSKLRCQKASRPATRPTLRFSDLRSLISNLRAVRQHCPADARASAFWHTHAQAQPHPSLRAMAGPASRSRLASRCQKGRVQRALDGPDGPSHAPPHNSRFP